MTPKSGGCPARSLSLLCYQRLTCANNLPFVRKCLFCMLASEHVEVGLARSSRGITQAEMTCQCSPDPQEPALVILEVDIGQGYVQGMPRAIPDTFRSWGDSPPSMPLVLHRPVPQMRPSLRADPTLVTIGSTAGSRLQTHWTVRITGKECWRGPAVPVTVIV